MSKLTEIQHQLYTKIPEGWQSEADICNNVKGFSALKLQLQRMAMKGVLDCELKNNTLYYKK